MSIPPLPAVETTKKEPPSSEPSAKQKYTLSNYLIGQLPDNELSDSTPRLVSLASSSASDILKEYSGGERPSTLPTDTSDPRVFNRTNVSTASSTHSLHTSDSVDISSSQSESVMTSVIHSQSRDQIREFQIMLSAAQKGSSEAQFNLGTMYEKGLGVEQDNAQAVYWFRKAAEQGDAGAQCNLGVMYEHGLGVEQDDAQAVIWYRQAAEQGDAGAQFNFGVMYEKGQGVEQDDAQAVYWYRKAAEQGYADAQCNLGCMYEEGHGIKEDKSEAAYWYRKAADQGDADAQFNLGFMYAKGRGVKQDQTEAFKWYRKAAEQGHAGAQFQMGKMYAKGKGVEANDVKAFNWYLKAANNGSKDAHLKLASYYQEGLGVKKDVLQATYWLLRSVVQEQNREIFLDEDAVEDDFYSDVIQSIPKALTLFPEFKYIQTINFRNIALRDQEFLSLGQLIRANPPLEGLNLEDQELDDADALIFAQSLAFNTTLTELIFDDEYDFDTTIFDEIKASLAQNVVIAELRERMKGHLITGPDGLPILVPYITRSDELPLEVLEIIVDKLILEASKAGKDKKAIIAGIDEFLLNVSSKTL